MGDILKIILFAGAGVSLPIEAPRQYLAFEWIGPINYLHEEPKLGTKRRRGLTGKYQY